MAKLLSIIAVLAVLTVSNNAFAAPADVSSTSTFTFTVVDETLGLNISGATDLPEVISKSAGGTQEITFSGITIENSGNTKGFLYASTLPPTGISWGSATGDLLSVKLNGGGYSTDLNEIENKLQTLLSTQDSDADRRMIGPKEKLVPFDVVWSAQGQLPTGQLTVPIKWVIKAS